MKHNILLLVPIFLVTVSAARHKEKKATLEDVEREYITTKARLSPPPAPKTSAKSPTQFGFVPVKTAATYAQKEPKIIYAQPEYTPDYQGGSQYNTIAYSASLPPLYPSASQQYSPESQQYSTGPQKSSLGPQQHSAGSQQYSYSPQYTEAVQKQKQQEQAYYVPQEQHLNYDNQQYITDNSVDQTGQQYYNPQQYYYLQQYQAPSTSIQAIVDPKGGLQYIMYIPTFVPQEGSQSQNEQLAYSNPDQTYQQPDVPQYTTYTEKQPAYSEKQNYEVGKSAYTPKGEFTTRREPKSLLDSYIPSSIQLQYYKQAQSHLNSLQDSHKYGNYNQLGAESSVHYNYRNRDYHR